MHNWGGDCKIVNVLGFVFCTNIWKSSAQWFHKAESKMDFSPKKTNKQNAILHTLALHTSHKGPGYKQSGNVFTCFHDPKSAFFLRARRGFTEDHVENQDLSWFLHICFFLCEAQGHDRLCLMTELSSFYSWTDSVGWYSLIGYSKIDMIGRTGDRQDFTENSFFLFAPEWWQWKIIWGIGVRNLKRWEV